VLFALRPRARHHGGDHPRRRRLPRHGDRALRGGRRRAGRAGAEARA
jgi:hypothetical protein